MSAKQTKTKPGEVGTTGHSWDGIEELNNPLPRWWVMIFYITIAFAVVYSVLYPAWPMLTRATPGILGYSTRGAVAEDIERFNAQNQGMRDKLVATPLDQIKDDAQLMQFAQDAGAAVFRNNCSQCHGSGAAGVQSGGFPNLLDNDWLWGGSLDDIVTTITHGVRNADDSDARFSQMPAFGKDQLLEPAQIDAVVQYVMSFSNAADDPALVEQGKQIFADNCEACHGEDGKGDRAQGAPNLTDSIWLYGGDKATLTQTVTNARFGVMPSWSKRGLSDSDIRSVAIYVHGLGGGE